MWYLHQTLLQSLGSYVEEGQNDFKSLWEWKTPRKNILPDTAQIMYISNQRLLQHTWGLYRSMLGRPQSWEEKKIRASILIQEAISNWQLRVKGELIFSTKSHCIYKTVKVRSQAHLEMFGMFCFIKESTGYFSMEISEKTHYTLKDIHLLKGIWKFVDLHFWFNRKLLIMSKGWSKALKWE